MSSSKIPSVVSAEAPVPFAQLENVLMEIVSVILMSAVSGLFSIAGSMELRQGACV